MPSKNDRVARFIYWGVATYALYAMVPSVSVSTASDNRRHLSQNWMLDFTKEPSGRLDASRWEIGGLGWSVKDGRLRCETGGASGIAPLEMPHAAEGILETIVRPERAMSREWKVLGLRVVQDDTNYWQLALVETPEAQGNRRYVELIEMLRNTWLANLEQPTALRVVAQSLENLAWEYGRDYRLRVELSPTVIKGEVEELGTGRTWHVGYALEGDCVRTGKPALSVSGMDVSFSRLEFSVHRTVPPPPRARPRPYTVPSMSSLRTRATGFFRIELINGRWWLIDPRGFAFYAVGTDHVNYRAHWCEKLGYAPYSRNVQQKYGSEEKWAASAAERLKAWGFNTLGAGHSESVRYRGLVHTVFLALGTAFTSYGDIVPRTTWTGFPDVFDPRFEEFCEIEARRQCGPHRDDPWLLGYFLDNELEWFGKNGTETGIVDEMMKKPASHPAKQAFVDMLRNRYATIAALNQAWQTAYPSFEALAQAMEMPATGTAVLRDRRDFVRLTADRYFSITTRAIRRADPNHLILGCRFAGFAPPIWDIAGKYLDVVSVNYYGTVDLERGVTTDMPAAMNRYYRDAKRPLLITEWSFPALDAGLPCQHGAGQRVPTQKDKAWAYEVYQRALFGMPFMVGSHYFMWVDEPELGISSTFPEDSNYGLVDVHDRPWPELTETAARVNRMAVAIHSGKTAEVSATVQSSGVLVRNQGTVPANLTTDIWVQGRRQSQRMQVPPGVTRRIPLPVPQTALVVVQLDPERTLPEVRLDDNRAFGVVGRRPEEPHVLVANPSDQPLTRIPVVLKAPAVVAPHVTEDERGRPVVCQWDRLPTGDELTFVVPNVPPRSLRTFRLLKAARHVSQATETREPFRIRGKLDMEWNGTSGDLLDNIRLEGTHVGRLTLLTHQINGQPLWVPPSTTVRATTWSGPVRTVRLVQVQGGGAPEAARTAVNTQGSYAPITSSPRRFTMEARLDFYPAESWWDVQVLSVRNADTVPWKLASYFIYPESRIAGSAADDKPYWSGTSPRWYDEKTGIAYGAMVDTRVFAAHFWKDTPEGESQHADIYRTVNRTLRPADAFVPRPPDPAVRIYVLKGDPIKPDNPVMRRLDALKRVTTYVSWEKRRK